MPLLATSGLISKTAGDIQAERDKARREQEAHAQTLAINQYNLEQARAEAERIKALRAGLIEQAEASGREFGSIPGVPLAKGAPRAAPPPATPGLAEGPVESSELDIGVIGLDPRPQASPTPSPSLQAPNLAHTREVEEALANQRNPIARANLRGRMAGPGPTPSLEEQLADAKEALRRPASGIAKANIRGRIAKLEKQIQQAQQERPPEAATVRAMPPSATAEDEAYLNSLGVVSEPANIARNTARVKILKYGEGENYTWDGRKLDPDTYHASARALLDPDNNETFAREALSRMQNYFIRKGESETDAMRLAAQAWHQGFDNIDNAEAKKYGDSVMARVAGGMSLLEAIAQEETRGEAHPDSAVSNAGAVGRYQIKPQYAHKFMVGDHTISISDFVGGDPAKEIGKPIEQQVANARAYDISKTAAVQKYQSDRSFYSSMMKMAANTGNYELYHQIAASRQALDQGVMGSVAAEYHKEKNYSALFGVLQDYMGEPIQWEPLPDGKYRVTANGREIIEGSLAEVGRSARMLIDPMYYAQLTAIGTKRAENQAKLMGELRKIAAEYQGKAAVQEIKSRMKASLVQGSGGEVWLLKGGELFRIDSEILPALGGVIGTIAQPIDLGIGRG
jgi:hypothetical protein